MQFKAVLYANRMYTVCHAVAYSSSRNIYCFVLSELYNFLSLQKYLSIYVDSNEIIGEDNNFDDHLFCQNVSRQLLSVKLVHFVLIFLNAGLENDGNVMEGLNELNGGKLWTVLLADRKD